MEPYRGYARQVIDAWTALEIQEALEKDNTVEIMSGLEVDIEMINGETAQEKFNTLMQCKCCDKHTTTQPSKLMPWVECVSNNMISSDLHVQCECNCRHLARIICQTCT
jgi:hypothetical protein